MNQPNLGATDFNEFERRRDILMRHAQEENPLDAIPTEQLEAWAIRSALPDYEREAGLIEFDTAAQWVEDTPEFTPGPTSSYLMVAEMDQLGLDKCDPQSYNAAFNSLCEKGLLQVNQEAQEQMEQEVRQERRRRIVGQRASGVMSSKRGVEAPSYSEHEDFDRMSTEQIGALARRHMASGREW